MSPASSVLTHRGSAALRRLVELAPSTGSLALWAHHRDVDDAPGAFPTTDGHTLFYPPGMASLRLPEQMGAVAHAVLHLALRHPQRFVALQGLLGDVDLALFNVCADAIVNSALSHLSWLSLPAGAVRLEALLARALGRTQTAEAALLEWDVERLYRAIDDRLPTSGGGDGAPRKDQRASPRPRADGARAAAVRALGGDTPPDLVPSDAARAHPEAEADAAREWTDRLVRGHASDGAFSMLRALLGDLPRPRTPWEYVFRRAAANALTPQPETSWSRPSRSFLANQGRAGPHRRMPFEPGFSGSRAVPRLVVVVDTSGSIDTELLGRFAAEVESMTRRLGAGLTVVWGDDHVERVEHFAPGASGLRERPAHQGGGGTDFTPLLEEAAAHRPDLVVVLTDLDGPARTQPRCPVLWAVPPGTTLAPPFGRALTLSFA